MATPYTTIFAAFAIAPNDLVDAFIAASSASRALVMNVPPAINSLTFSDQSTEDVGLFFNEFGTVCGAQGWSHAQMLNRLLLSLQDNALNWWHRRTAVPGETWSNVKNQMRSHSLPYGYLKMKVKILQRCKLLHKNFP